MNTECNPNQLYFQGLGGRKVVGCFDGGTITSDAGALLLREIDEARNLFDSFSRCFADCREPRFVEHSVKELIAQRTIGICLGYEDLIDEDWSKSSHQCSPDCCQYGHRLSVPEHLFPDHEESQTCLPAVVLKNTSQRYPCFTGIGLSSKLRKTNIQRFGMGYSGRNTEIGRHHPDYS